VRETGAATLTEVARRTGHRFATPALLDEALTHSSAPRTAGAGPPCNERLEFLGDRVLGLAVADMLHRTFPDASVGDLARRHAALVCREALDAVAQGLGLPSFLRMSKGEEEAGGRDNPGLVADACEALIAAIYLDGGLPAAAAFIERNWRPLLAGHRTPPKDAKTALQEWLQGRGLPLPVYREAARSGPAHAPTFCVEVDLPDRGPVRASGGSKRAAEQAAARSALQVLQSESGP
jgi:ribonuclease-3